MSDDLFAPIPLWLLRRRDVSDAAKVAWARLKLFAGRKGSCNTSHEVLAGECGASRRTIQRAVDELARAELVTLKRGRYGIEYTFPDAPKRCISDQPQIGQNGASEIGQNGASQTAQMRQNGAPDAPKMDIYSLYLKRGIKDDICSSPDERVSAFALQPESVRTPPKRSPKPDLQSQWFCAFWSGIWRKRGKGPAEKAFRRLIKTESDFRLVMAARNRDLPEMLGREENFRPHPATWLNAGDWRESPGDTQPARLTADSILRAAMATDTVPDWEGGGR